MSTTTPTKAAKRWPAGPADLKSGERRIVQAGAFSIGIFYVDGRYHAVRNHCPHEGAELCKGRLTGTNLPNNQPGTYEWGRENLIIRCPWHQWEFDLETGRHLASDNCRVRIFQVIEEAGELFVEI